MQKIAVVSAPDRYRRRAFGFGGWRIRRPVIDRDATDGRAAQETL
jgi:hypothetical protein